MSAVSALNAAIKAEQAKIARHEGKIVESKETIVKLEEMKRAFTTTVPEDLSSMSAIEVEEV
jgi:hypothetical protein